MRLLIALAVWIAAALAAVAVSGAVESGIGSSSGGAATSSASSSQSGSDSFDASSVSAADSQSLFHRANFARALAAARSQLGSDARIDNFVLYPGYLSVTAARNGSELNYYVDAQGGSHTVTSPGSSISDTLFPLSSIDVNGVSVLAQRISTRAHVHLAQLHYLVIEPDSASRSLRWLVYPLQGSRVEYFEAASPGGTLYEYLKNSSGGPQPVR